MWCCRQHQVDFQNQLSSNSWKLCGPERSHITDQNCTSFSIFQSSGTCSTSYPFFLFVSLLFISGRRSSRGVWRREDVCCSASSSSRRTRMASWRARPRRERVVGCVWASNAAPTWQPWTSMASLTPTLKRKRDIQHVAEGNQLEPETRCEPNDCWHLLKKLSC